MANKNSNNSFLLLVALLILGLGVAIFYAVSLDNTAQPETQTAVIEPAAAAGVEIDVKEALSDRILGNPSAPIKISEHSSFTCGHCGSFHKNTYKAFKAAYIDTGKAYLMFSDFPLNGPALHASMTARCLPKDKYFDFVQMLFERQDEWAYNAGYMTFLKKMSETYGLDNEKFKACVQNKDLQNGILARMKASQTQWSISSTPSFVVNNKTTISGALPFHELKQKIDAATEGSGNL